MSQPTISHHLRILRTVRLVAGAENHSARRRHKLRVFRLIVHVPLPLELGSGSAISAPSVVPSRATAQVGLLREAGVVRTSRLGTCAFYELNRERIALLRRLESLLNVVERDPVSKTGEHTMETEDE